MKTNYTTPIEGGIEQGSQVLPGSIRFVGWDYGNSVAEHFFHVCCVFIAPVFRILNINKQLI